MLRNLHKQPETRFLFFRLTSKVSILPRVLFRLGRSVRIEGDIRQAVSQCPRLCECAEF